MLRSALLSIRRWAPSSDCVSRSTLQLPSTSPPLLHPVRFQSKTTVVSKAVRKKRLRQAAGLAAFHEYYTQHYGPRWETSLFPALQQPTRSGALINRYIGVANQTRIEALFSRLGAEAWPAAGITLARQCWQFPVSSPDDALPSNPLARPATSTVDAISPSRFPAPHTVHALVDSLACVSADARYPVLPYYPLDLASVLAVEAMGLQGHERVLDLCAAPGGKSITIAQKLRLEEPPLTPDAPVASLDANDVSADRHKRLVFTLRSYLPRAIVSDYSRVNIANKDALAARMPQSHYDAVLVDAPCSTDRHMLHSSPTELESWSTGRFRRDRERQIALVLQALRTVREGGVVVYATCSLSPQENDDVIRSVRSQVDKWINKGRTGVEGIQIDFTVEKMVGPSAATAAEIASDPTAVRMPFGESTEFGWIILPDQTDAMMPAPVLSAPLPSHGWGPLYLCKLRRTRPTDTEATKTTESAPAEQ